MYQIVVDTFIEWCRNLNPELAKEIFHEKLMYKGCAKDNAKDLMLSGLIVSGSSDFNLIKTFNCNNEAMVIIEHTDEATNLYYRLSFYLKLADGKIIEVIETKEHVAK